jgi:4-amino-4-deoxy-L-arabinose transferase-like glycosyltransferase
MNRDTKIIIGFIGAALLLFFPFLGHLHLFDWDEINFAESAREMLITKDYMTVQIFFEPFWEKPPLFIWLQSFSMKFFGVNEFAARFPNAIAGMVTLIILYRLGRRLLNEKFGLILAISYGASLLPFFYFKSGIIDPWFNLFIFLGIAYYVFAQREQLQKKKYFNIAFSAAFIGLAVLTKGPAAILMFGLTAFFLLIFERLKLHFKIGQVLVFILTLTFVGGFWFILMILGGNWDTVVEFIIYQIRLFSTQDAGHGGFPLYHFVVLLIGVFPAAAFAIHGHKKQNKVSEEVAYFRKAMLILFWVVLILFSIVKTKIVHYSSLCYFPLSFLAAYSIYSFIEKKERIPLWLGIVQIFTASLIGLVVILLPVFDKYKGWFVETGKITHSFTVGNLEADPGWVGWEWLIGLLLIVGVVLSIIRLRRNKLHKGFLTLAISSTVFIFLAILVVTPKIEKYSQNAAIEFMKSIKDKDVYLGTLYKSYAKLFYTEFEDMTADHAFMQHWNKLGNIGNKDAHYTQWLTRGEIDKITYLIVRKDKLEANLKQFKDLEILFEKNGYVFLQRLPKTLENSKD